MRSVSIRLAVLVVLGLLAAVTASASTFVPESTAQLLDDSDQVVRAIVTGKWVSVDAETGVFTSHVTMRVRDRIVGSAPDTVTVDVPGGEIGENFNIITGHPYFAVGQDVIVFLNDDRTRVVGDLLGKLTITQGVVFEKGIEVEDYVDSIRSMANGGEPLVELDAEFHPVSTLDALLAERNQRFDYSGMRWYQYSINITVNENDPDGSGEGDAVRAAMTTWNNTPAHFTYNYSGTNSRTNVTQNYQNEVMWSNDTEGNAIAYTAIWGSADQVVECDLAFLNSYSWSSVGNPAGNEMDTQNIATHEFGHFLVLGDLYNPSDYQKTMYGYAGPGETNKRSLEQDDINGIIYIYGSSGDDDDDTSDDDTADDDSGDDDWHDDDSDDDDSGGGDDDTVGPVGDCSELLTTLYGTCDYALPGADGPISGHDAYASCQDGGDSWSCVFDCAANDNVNDCDSFGECVKQLCGFSLLSDSSGGGDDDDDDSSSCGF